MKEGILLIISGPSGVGKGSVIKVLSSHDEVAVSVSATTRKPRAFEKDGVDYFFMSKEEFKENIEKDNIVEYNEYCGNFYGRMKDRLKELLKKHEVVLLEIDVNGAEKVYEKMKCVRVFVLPPSFSELKKRLLKRGSETEEVLKKRLDQAFVEIEKSGRYDYLIVNESVEQTAKYLKEIITAEKLKTFRSIKKIEQLLKERF